MLGRCVLLCALFVVQFVRGSPGDRLDEFNDCTDACEYMRKCPNSEVHFNSERNPFFEYDFTETPSLLSIFLFWDCISDCDYQCQHIITNLRIRNNDEIYQFHGKWPFFRIMGTQEFFSTLFSIGNFIPHYLAFKKLSERIRKLRSSNTKTDMVNSKTLINYLYVTIAGMLAWTASTVFHLRDLIITEKLDYFFAGMTVLTGFHAIFARMTYLHKFPRLGKIFTTMVLFIFSLHILRLYVDWSYTYNMRFNVFFGILQYILLLMLAFQNYTHIRNNKISLYYSTTSLVFKLCVTPVLLVLSTAMAMTLELFDFFSYDWQIDAHAIWHFCTIWPSFVLYDFFLTDFDTIAQAVL
ncbi:hypothetical protein KAFR_0D00650 [Kazachstania africana CBS 2517]|uniref:Post-GPI attachment to proteins factor 3 n=1 Tax=Kazachstania africana (strain ATCC 22294 / BCRC 22015 / CBS 2517 / CECT 1963 / NBRC 1671 / NRRL Y-8276) TaxID=1071382 RepID=H2ATL2_KAZAF|nr:hypothetical protein KAFR_0D00650 [Kazachstania africana CBS 2517]CCF57712.1 hypothetical protein KAFR_0D00650 [Kazachstania africana CBS 2517]